MAPGGEGGPLRPGDETSLPYCAAQRNMDNGGCGGGVAAAEGAPAAPRTRDSAWRSPGPDAAVGGDGRAAGGVAFHVGRPTGIVEVRVQ